MTEKNTEMECTITSYSILAHMGFKCITEDGKDITDDLKKAIKVIE